MTSTLFTFKNLCIASIILRVILLIYGEFQDHFLTVKYTDIDYIVFTDAARFVTQNASPYQRATYRYTPLLAIFLTPNIYLFKSFGKILFVTADIVVGVLIHQILTLRGMPSKKALKYDALWLLNPMVANISTRGNAESLLGVMVLGSLYMILRRNTFYWGCAVFGLAVHFKIYPVIYAIPIVMLLDESYGEPWLENECPLLLRKYKQLRHTILNISSSGQGHDPSKAMKAIEKVILFLNPVRVLFALTSAGTFFLLTSLMYQGYGDEFMQHSYFYHVTREDHRHNFSVWFYQLYLGMDHKNPWVGLLAFLPQMSLVALVGITFGKDVFFACFIQTFLFVAFNKVCTSQYFMWYICLFPLILSSSKINFRWKGLVLLLAWIAGQGLWLNYAYQLEFLGQNTFLQLWIAGIGFFIANCWIVVELILNHRYEPIYGSSGRIRWALGMGDPGTKRN